MEIIDIVDEFGEPTGETVDRVVAHAQGIRHRTSHVWLMRNRGGGTEILLQKRSDDKDSFPGCFDISSAGHIPAGVGFKASAIRELKEELGLDAREEELVFVGDLQINFAVPFYGKPFVDNQYSRVFYILRDIEPEEMTLQKEEVSGVIWIPLAEVKNRIDDPSFKHCLLADEVNMLPEIEL